ncbi:hypothetical protein [Alteromonas gracilis]|uniref:hypothetical protein n=1 Tax=Alteromonas gracilis TaxID=1479524 RepID=UPI00373503F9
MLNRSDFALDLYYPFFLGDDRTRKNDSENVNEDVDEAQPESCDTNRSERADDNPSP